MCSILLDRSWFSKTEGNTYSTLLHHPFLFKGKPTQCSGGSKASAGKTPQSASATETAIQEGGNANRTSVTFAVPLTSAQPSASTAQTPADPSSLFIAHHVQEDQVGAAKEAIRQAGIMMEQVKVVWEASQAAYDASSALQSNFQVG